MFIMDKILRDNVICSNENHRSVYTVSLKLLRLPRRTERKGLSILCGIA